jgi:hypothetical protein
MVKRLLYALHALVIKVFDWKEPQSELRRDENFVVEGHFWRNLL